MKDKYLEKLGKAFGDFKFFPEDHHYEYKGQRVGISVTRFIEEFCNEFDAVPIAERVAEKRGVSVQEILEEWEYKNDFSCEKGSAIHNFEQSLWEHDTKPPHEFTSWIDNQIMVETIYKISKQCVNFYDDFKDKLELVGNEYVVGNDSYDIASAVDSLFINKSTNGLVLVDYKTNSNIHKNEKYAKDMKAPLQHLKDFTLNHYAIQLSIYRYLIETYAKIDIEEMFIVWFSENNDNYEIINVPYLKDDVENILEWRKWML